MMSEVSDLSAKPDLPEKSDQTDAASDRGRVGLK